MQLFRSFFLFGGIVAAACALLLPCADAQDAAPTPAADANPTAAEAADLFPSGGAAATPAHANGGHGGHRNGGGRGRNNRRHDQLVTQADADPLQLRVAYRRAETLAMARDPGLADLIHQAAAADTDPEKRAYLKEYYTRLFTSVRRIDPSPEMKAHVDLLTQVAEQRYDPKRREVGGDEDLVNGRGRGRRGRSQ